MDYIENQTFDEIQVGDTASLTRTLTREDIELFAVMSGDVNPAHLDQEYASTDMFHKIIAHGMWGGALISTLLGTKLPGPGAIYLGQTLRFQRPVAIGDAITVSVTAISKDTEKKRITFECNCVNQKGQVVISGNAEVLAPTEKVKRPRIVLPEVQLYDRGMHLRKVLDYCNGLDPVRVAVVHPLKPGILNNIAQATEAGLIIPVLVGPEARIKAAAEADGVDISRFEFYPTEHSTQSAIQAVALARQGEVEALAQGSAQVEELLRAVLAPGTGLRTNRRMSYLLMLDMAGHTRPLFLTDMVLNIYPSLEEKRDIVQNGIEFAQLLKIETPKVAILSGVERINPRIRSTLDAAALCKMAERGQIKGGALDGPLSFDTAISQAAALERGIDSAVAGCADILMVPDLESGSLLAKQLLFATGTESAGVVLGAKVPIVLNYHSDSLLGYLASFALASLLAHSRKTSRELVGVA